VIGLPTFIAFTPDGKLAYLTDDGAGEVTPIRVATNTPEPPIKVGLSNGIVASIVFIR
jgi:DNA-binding beta-propeller fold protein YncE